MQVDLKKLLFIASIGFFTFQTFGQVEKQKLSEPVKVVKQEEVIYDIIDEPAEYPGGNEALKLFIKENLKCPETAVKLGVDRKCYLQFVITKEGAVSNVKVKVGIKECEECEIEAVRVIQSMPNWKPAKSKGENVNSTFSIPVHFYCAPKSKN
jgi:periplasmic protein TonB